VKEIIQETATNMPYFEPWEVGTGYINAYAAVDYAIRSPNYGSTVNMFRDFNSDLNVEITRLPFMIDYNPIVAFSESENRFPFAVPAGITGMEVRADVHGQTGEDGNTINLVLISPDGAEYSSGVYVLFPLYHDRTVAVANPIQGDWIVELRGLRGDPANPTSGLDTPEDVLGRVKLVNVIGYSGLNDIAGHPANHQ
jgi:serine protease AprX